MNTDTDRLNFLWSEFGYDEYRDLCFDLDQGLNIRDVIDKQMSGVIDNIKSKSDGAE